MNLKTRILAFVFQHPTGVRIIDMEKPLGEQRMKLGYATQCLLEEGKIIKIEDKYYPCIEEEDGHYSTQSFSKIKK